MGGALVGRIPEGMIGLSLVLLVRSVTASFASAGTVVAAFGIGSAVGGILQGRRIDRTRQTPVLVGCGLVHPAALVLVVVATQHRALALMVALAAVAGVSAPAFTPCMRALWSSLLQDDRQRHAAFALEAVVVEATFLIGPALVAGLLTAVSPATALLAAAGMSGTGALAFAASGASRRWRGQGAPPSLAGPLASAGVRTLLVAAFLFGAGDGLLQIAAPAFAVDRGAPALAGLLLAGMSVGSLVGGAVYGARAWPGRAPVRFALLQGLLAAGLALAAAGTSPAGLLGLLMLAGLLVAPIATENSHLIDATAPAGSITEAFAWLITAVVLGGAAGTAAAGTLIERAGFAPTLLAAAAVVALAGLVTWTRRHRLEPGGGG